MFAKKAPRKMPGQSCFPNKTRTASATPVGGHTAVALGFKKANNRPIFAAAT
jgi:hypothetical protein